MNKESHLVEQPKQTFVGSEANYKETVDEEDLVDKEESNGVGREETKE